MTKILIFFYLLASTYVLAQPLTIKGTIYDENKKYLEAANVYIMNMDSIMITGSSTNSKGVFSLEIPAKGNYILSVSYLGYSEQHIQIKGIDRTINIGDIFLMGKDRILDEVVVTSKSQIMKSDKILLFPTENQVKHSADGFSLLNNLMIPQINVDVLKKTVSSRGKIITLLINGRPVTDKSEITALRPQDIVRIEYHEMPTGSLAEYECVINYITRQYELGGYIGVNGTQQTTYGEGDYLIISRLNCKKSEHTLGYDFNFLYDNKIHKNISEKFIYPNNDILCRTNNGQPSIEKNHTQHIFYNYNFQNKQTQLNIKLGYKKYISDENFNSLLNYKGTVEQSLILSDINNEKQSNPYLYFYTDFKLKQKQTLYIRGDIDYSTNSYNYTYIEDAGNFEKKKLQSNTSEDYWSTILGAIYSKEFSKGREITLNLHNYTTISNSTYNNENNINKERLTTSESLYLFNASKKWQKFFLSIRLGMSSLFYFQKDKKDKQYWSFRPRVTFRYLLGEKGSIQYRASLDNSFPTLSLFTDTEQNIDFIQKRRGNPSLKIVEIFSNQLSYSYEFKKVNLNLSFNSFHSGPNTGRQVVYDDNYFIHSYMNEGRYNFINPELGISMKLWNNLVNIKIDGGLNRYVITGTNTIRTNDWYINTSLLLFYKKISASIYNYSPRKGAYASLEQWSKSDCYGLVLSYNNKGISLSIGTQNPFSTYHSTKKINLNIYSFKNSLYNVQDDHLFYIKATYNFDFGRKHQFSQINTKKSTNSAIMKNSIE